jgi:hypothetical protein
MDGTDEKAIGKGLKQPYSNPWEMLGRNEHDKAATKKDDLEVDPYLNDTKPPKPQRE